MLTKHILIFAAFILATNAMKPKYDIDMEKLEIVYVNPVYGTMEGDVHKYNDTTKAFSGSGEVRKELSSANDINVELRGYAMKDGEYKETPFHLNFKLCDTYGMIFSMFGKDIKDGNLPNDCPIATGKYYVKNFVPDVASVLPPVIPGNFEKMMLSVNGTNAENQLVISLKGYGRVIHH